MGPCLCPKDIVMHFNHWTLPTILTITHFSCAKKSCIPHVLLPKLEAIFTCVSSCGLCITPSKRLFLLQLGTQRALMKKFNKPFILRSCSCFRSSCAHVQSPVLYATEQSPLPSPRTSSGAWKVVICQAIKKEG